MALFTGSKEGWENQRFLLANWLEVLPYKWVERSEKMKPSFDSVMALMRELSIEEQLALLNSDNRPAIKRFLLSLQVILTPVGTITVWPEPEFNPPARFGVSTKKAPTMFSYVGNNFKAWFLTHWRPSVSEAAPDGGPYRQPGVQNNATEVTFRYHTLNRGSLDAPIIAALGGETKVETTIAEIYALLIKQANGETGALLTNGYANIFYLRDVNGVLCAVSVCWGGGGWRVSAYSVGNPCGWRAGNQVFSRDS